MSGFLKTFLLALTLVAGFTLADSTVLAQENPPVDPVSAYQPLRCQNQRDGSVTCTYPSGQQAQSCTVTTVGGTTTRYECQNPDGGKTQCDRGATGNLDGRGVGSSGTQTVCRVYDSSGTIVTTRDTTNSGGRTTGEVTGSDGNTEQINESNMGSAGDSCWFGNVGACIRNLPGMLFVGIGFIFLTLSGMMLFLAGTVFNWVVLRTVFQFGEYFGTSEGMLVAWGVMRDIANIGLLFGFILMGVLLILNVEGGGHGHGGGISAKRAIPRLLIFAVLLNFSLFTTQFVVDIANAFGSSFSSLAGTECSTVVTGESGNAGGQSLEECTNLGISGKIIQSAGLTNIFGDGRGDLQAILSNLTGRPYSYAVSLIMLSIFVLVTAFVLLAGAIMLAIRVVVLSFLMVTSPIGFAGMVIPGLSGIASKWWHTLISQSFFAPVYLLLIFISIKLTEGLMQGEASLTNALIADRGNAVAGNIQVVMVFLIVIGFMVASLITAQKMGAMGAGFATKMAAIPFAMAGRNTIGRASARGLKSYEAAMGRARGSSNRLVSTLAKSPLGNFADDSIGGALKGGKNLKIGGYRSFGEEEKFREERGSHLAHAAEQAEQKKKLKEALDSNESEKIESALQKMGVSDIKDVLGDNAKHLATIAQNLSPEKFAQLMKEKEIDTDTKHKLQEGRFEKVVGTMQKGTFDEKKNLIRSLSNKDLEQIAQNNPELFSEIASVSVDSDDGLISKDQRDHLKKSDNLTRSQRSFVKSFSGVERVKAYLKDDATPEQKAAVGRIAGKLGADIAELDFDQLNKTPVLASLTKSSLAAIQAKNKLNDSQVSDILKGIQTSGNPNVDSIKAYLDKNNSAGAYWGTIGKK